MPLITFGGNSQGRNVPVPVGRSFTFAASGTTGFAEFSVQWFDGVLWHIYPLSFGDLTDPITTTLINYGAINEIRIECSAATINTDVRVIVNVIPIERALM